MSQKEIIKIEIEKKIEIKIEIEIEGRREVVVEAEEEEEEREGVIVEREGEIGGMIGIEEIVIMIEVGIGLDERERSRLYVKNHLNQLVFLKLFFNNIYIYTYLYIY